MRPDRILITKTIERTLAYNIVTREFKVAALQGETRPVFTTRDLRDAQRVLSEIRGVKMTPAATLDPTAVIYVRVQAETALNGENTFVARMNGTAEQTEQVFANLKAVLAAAGTSLQNVVKTTVYLADMADFAQMNEVYAKHFGTHKPARSTVQAAGLPKGARVEIDAVAVKQ